MSTAELAAACLSFDASAARKACEQWAALDQAQRRGLLTFADRSGLTLHLWRTAKAAGIGPQLAHAGEYEERLRKNRLRLEKRKEESAELLELFCRAGLRAAVLKGFTLEPDFVSAAEDRVQYDLDFYLSQEDARAAFELLRARGYEPLPGHDRRPTDHLPVLVRKTGWEWRGDFFDVDIPAGIELHFRLWDAEFERIPLEMVPEPLERISIRNGVPMLDRGDQLAFCTLHVLRHLFRGSLRLSHLYEIAWFLETHAEEARFWRQWRALPNEPLRRLCAAGFALAARIFDCRPAPELEPEIERLPPRARVWIEKYGSTVLEPERSGKVEVLLQLSFVPGWRDGLVVLRRRLLPLSLPGPVDGVYLSSLSPARRVLRAARQGRFLLSRGFFQLRALPAFLRAAAGWWM